MDENQPIVKERKARFAAEVDETEARTKMWQSITTVVENWVLQSTPN